MSGLTPVAEALSRILAAADARPREAEVVPVARCAGRVLAADVAALRTQPPFDLSAMDGYALVAADTDPPGKPLTLIGESAAGHAFTGRIEPGETVRIFTGAALPAGADAVLIQERAGRTEDKVVSEIALRKGTFVRGAGRDFHAGDVLIKAGKRLSEGDIALAGAMGHAALPVCRRTLVAILATGDELVLPGEATSPDAIVSTNSYAIAAMLARAGAETLDLGIARDEAASLHSAFDAALAARADCLVTLGGASVGAHDLVRPVAAERGARLDFYKIAMRPGKPLNFGALGGMLLAGLPGNPVSALVCARLFLVPLVRALQGDAAAGADETEPARLGGDLKPNDEREDYLRARLERGGDGGWVATAFTDQDSSLLSVFARADALLIRPPHAPEAKTGGICRILRF